MGENSHTDSIDTLFDRMASVWLQSSKTSRTDGLVTTYQTLPQTDRHHVCVKTKLSHFMKRVLNMSKCSRSSRSLLVQMRDQLKDALEREGVVPPESPYSRHTSCSDGPQHVLNSAASDPQPTRSEAALETDSPVHQQNAPAGVINSNLRHLDCAYCIGFMVQPVCLPCGHSVCKSCLEKTTVGGDLLACPNCSQTFPCVPVGFGYNSGSSSRGQRTGSGDRATPSTDSRRPTLMLQNALFKWYPEWVESAKHKDEGNIFANEGDFLMAVQWYDKALQTGWCVLKWAAF